MDVHTNTEPQQELHSELKDLASRDLRLWSIGFLVLVVLAIGIAALILPNLMWKSAPIQVQANLLPQLFSGFIALVVLFNAYLISQRRQLSGVRDNLLKRLLASSSKSEDPTDALTHLLSRETVSATLAREKSRSDRQHSPLSVAVVDIADFKSLNRKYGNLVGDHALLVVAQILKATFRGSDTVTRLGGDEFLVVMPDTDALQAGCAVRRLMSAMRVWNATTDFQYKLSLHAGIASYVHGSDLDQVVAEAARKACTQDSPTIGLTQRWFHTPVVDQQVAFSGSK